MYWLKVKVNKMSKTEKSEFTEYNNAVVVIHPRCFKDRIPKLFKITGGKICLKGMMGCSMFGYYLDDENEKVREDPYQIWRFATEKEIESKTIDMTQVINDLLEADLWRHLYYLRLSHLEYSGVYTPELAKEWNEEDRELEEVDNYWDLFNKIREIEDMLEK